MTTWMRLMGNADAPESSSLPAPTQQGVGRTYTVQRTPVSGVTRKYSSRSARPPSAQIYYLSLPMILPKKQFMGRSPRGGNVGW